MSRAARYGNLRGGALSGVSGIMPSTISSWGLQLGEKKGGGHPRYSLADVVAVVLMKELALEMGLKASRATHIVTKFQREIPQLIEEILEDASQGPGWSTTGGPYLLAEGFSRSKKDSDIVVARVENGSLESLISEARPSKFIIVNMRRMVQAAMVGLSGDDVQDASAD